MCGIAGVYSDSKSTLALDGAISAMAHRGPDASGLWECGEGYLGLAHTRLSIQGVGEAGAQPMSSYSGNSVITYNGEIYNAAEVASHYRLNISVEDLRSDTRFLVELIEKEGLAALKYVNGIFAFGFYSLLKRELLVVRDRKGVKPLLCASSADAFLFSSELKALQEMGVSCRPIDIESCAQYMSYVWCPGDFLPGGGVRKLKPGEVLRLRAGAVTRPESYFLPEFEVLAREGLTADSKGSAVWQKKSLSRYVEDFRSELNHAVDRQLISDVEVGAFLSGGLDSSSIVAMATKNRQSMPCFTMAVTDMKSEDFVDDLPYARAVAEGLGVQLFEVPVSPQKLLAELPKLVDRLEEPIADPASINQFLICELAAGQGLKVLLSGTGGDDVLTGYRRHLAVKYLPVMDLLSGVLPGWLYSDVLVGKLPKGPARRMSKLRESLGMHGNRRLLQLLRWYGVHEVSSLFEPQYSQGLNREVIDRPIEEHLDNLDPQNDLSTILELDQRFFMGNHNLVYADRMSMATGVEVRVPFLDEKFMEYAKTLPMKLKLRGHMTKYILRKAMEGILPRHVIYRSKTGFGAPLRTWVNGPLRPMIEQILSEKSIRDRGVFSYPKIHDLLNRNTRGEIDGAYLIFSLICLELWFRRFE